MSRASPGAGWHSGQYFFYDARSYLAVANVQFIGSRMYDMPKVPHYHYALVAEDQFWLWLLCKFDYTLLVA